MPETVTIPLSDLLLYTGNPRLADEKDSQQDAMLELAKKEGSRILVLAADIVEQGLDPLSLPGVVSTPDQKKRYVVHEGNRRVLALKALETPSLISKALTSTQERKLKKLSKEYLKDPFHSIRCVLFESKEELQHWVWLRHTGQNEGAGLVEWGADEKDRFKARHGDRSPARQVLDFVERRGWLSEKAAASDKGIITSITRLVSNPLFRETVGIEKTKGDVYALFPADEIGKSLTHVVEDLKLERVQVSDIYHADDRRKYAESLPDSRLPDESERLEEPVLLDELPIPEQEESFTDEESQSEDQTSEDESDSAEDEKSGSSPLPRTALIPQDCNLNINPPRINQIYNELKTLSVDSYTNSASVMLRVFVELSTDHWIEKEDLLTDDELRNQPLAKKMKVVATDLHDDNLISSKLKDAIDKVSNSQAVIAANTPTFNMYVHNEYVYPNPSELRTAWDELQPFLATLW